jgi:hypothetical protein
MVFPDIFVKVLEVVFRTLLSDLECAVVVGVVDTRFEVFNAPLVIASLVDIVVVSSGILGTMLAEDVVASVSLLRDSVTSPDVVSDLFTLTRGSTVVVLLVSAKDSINCIL